MLRGRNTYIKVWRDDVQTEPIIVDGVKDLKPGDIFITVEHGNEGIYLKAISDPVKTERGYSIKTESGITF